MDIEKFFDRNYGSVERYWWKVDRRYSTNPDDHRASLLARSVLMEAHRRMPGLALDVGGGEGADAIRLALLGWSVDLIDISGVAIEKSRAFAESMNLDVRCRRQDAARFSPPRVYDIVTMNGSLHYIAEKASVIGRIQEATRPGGINVISLWSTHTPVPEEHRVVPTFPDDEDGVVTAAYAGWEIELVYFERGRMESGHDDFAPHMHSYIKMIARRPMTPKCDRRP